MKRDLITDAHSNSLQTVIPSLVLSARTVSLSSLMLLLVGLCANISRSTPSVLISDVPTGWNNDANLGSILSYVFYWIAVMGGLYYNKWSEGRCTFFGRGSSAYNRRMERRAEKARQPSPSISNGESTNEEVSHKKTGSNEDIGVAPLLMRDQSTYSEVDNKY